MSTGEPRDDDADKKPETMPEQPKEASAITGDGGTASTEDGRADASRSAPKYSLEGIGVGVSARTAAAAPQGHEQPSLRAQNPAPTPPQQVTSISDSPRPVNQPAIPIQPLAPPPVITTPQTDRWPVRGAVMFGLLAIALLFGGFGLWAWKSRIAGAVVASGQVEVEQQRQVVQHPDGGVVQEIAVKDGAEVAAGDLLIRLDGTLLSTELAIVEGQYFEILARRGRLETERADADTITFPELLTAEIAKRPELVELVEGQQSLFETRRDTLRQSLEQLKKQSEQVSQQVAGIDAQIVALSKQRELIGEELTDQESLLSRGLAQASRVLALQRESVRLDGQLGELQASRAQAGTKQTELDIQRLRLTAERREEAETELRDQSYRELEMAERRRSLSEQMSRLEIRAPVAGVVYDLQVTTPRSVIRAADPLLYLIPQDRPLVIGAKLATINIDEVHTGQPVVLRFAAFSSRTTPEIDGRLARVSADALMDEATRTPYYRAEVTIPPEELEKLGNLALVPGMPVEVYIQTGERSAMAYLLKPLTDYFNRAFREG